MIAGLELVPGRALASILYNTQARNLFPLFFALGATQPWPRRGHLQILGEMLQIISREGATKTAIVYKANINFTLANKYIEYLEDRRMIQRSNGGSVRTYTLTAKGREALQLLRRTMDEVFEEKSVLA